MGMGTVLVIHVVVTTKTVIMGLSTPLVVEPLLRGKYGALATKVNGAGGFRRAAFWPLVARPSIAHNTMLL